MLQFARNREIGLDPPLVLARAECSRRAYSVQISNLYNVKKIHQSGVMTLDIDSTESRYLLSGGADGAVCIHDVENQSGVPSATYECISTIGRSNKHRHTHSVETVQWYPYDNGMFLTSGADKLLKAWDANTLKPADEFQFNGIVYCHQMSAVATKHCLVAVATQSNQIKLIDLKSGSATHSLKGHKKPVYTLQWSTEDEHILASGSGDSRVLLWDVRMAKGALFILDQHNGDTMASAASVNTAHDGRVNGLTFLPDGLHLMTFGTDDCLRLWNVTTGRNMNINYGRIDNDCHKSIKICTTAGCRPEMVYVPNGSDIYVYDIFSGIRIATLRAHYTQVNCCCYHSDFQELYSGSNDRNILVWVPTSCALQAYEDHLSEHDETEKNKRKRLGFTSRTAATADAWSDSDD